MRQGFTLKQAAAAAILIWIAVAAFAAALSGCAETMPRVSVRYLSDSNVKRMTRGGASDVVITTHATKWTEFACYLGYGETVSWWAPAGEHSMLGTLREADRSGNPCYVVE